MGILQKLDVSESALKHKHMEKNLGSIRVDAQIGNKHYPMIRRLRTHFDWLRKLIGDWVYMNGNKKVLRMDLLTQIMALVATPLKRQVRTKMT